MAERKKAVIAGADFVILERDAHAGGTWRDNTYSGCGCDVPVPLCQLPPKRSGTSRSWSRNSA